MRVGFEVDWDKRVEGKPAPMVPAFTINAPAINMDPLSALALADMIREMTGLAARLRVMLGDYAVVMEAKAA